MIKEIEQVIEFYNEKVDGSKMSWEEYKRQFAKAIIKICRKKIAELEKENARLRKVLNVLNKDKIMEIITKVMDREFTRTCWSEEIALAMLREIGEAQMK